MYMKLIKRTYRFRLYPSDSQKDLIEKTLGCSRQVYNEFLSLTKKEYEKDPSKGDQNHIYYSIK